MADKTLQFSIEFRGNDDAVKKIAEINSQINNLTKSNIELRKELSAGIDKLGVDEYNKLSIAYAGNETSLKALKKTKTDLANVNAKEIEFLNTTSGSLRNMQAEVALLQAKLKTGLIDPDKIAESNSRINDLKVSIKALKVAQLEQADTTNFANNSIETNRALVAKLYAEYIKIKQPTADVTKNLRLLNDTLKEQESAIGDNRRNVGNYAEAFSQATRNIKIFGVDLGGAGEVTKGFTDGIRAGKDETGGLKDSIGAFLAGGGITAMVGLFSLATEALENYEPFVEGAERATASFGAAFAAAFRGDNFLEAAARAGQLTEKLQELTHAEGGYTLAQSQSRLAVEQYIFATKSQQFSRDQQLQAIKLANQEERKNSSEQLAFLREEQSTREEIFKNRKGITDSSLEVVLKGNSQLSESFRATNNISQKEVDELVAGRVKIDELQKESLNVLERTQRREQALLQQQRDQKIKNIDAEKKFLIETGKATETELINLESKRAAVLLSNTQLEAEDRKAITQDAQINVLNIQKEFANRELQILIKANDLKSKATTDNASYLIAIEREKAQVSLNDIKLNAGERANIIKEREQNIARILEDSNNRKRALEVESGKITAESVSKRGGDNTSQLVQNELNQRGLLLNNTRLTLHERENIIRQSELNVDKIFADSFKRNLQDKIEADTIFATHLRKNGKDDTDVLIEIEQERRLLIERDQSISNEARENQIAQSKQREEDIIRAANARIHNAEIEAQQNNIDALTNKGVDLSRDNAPLEERLKNKRDITNAEIKLEDEKLNALFELNTLSQEESINAYNKTENKKTQIAQKGFADRIQIIGAEMQKNLQAVSNAIQGIGQIASAISAGTLASIDAEIAGQNEKLSNLQDKEATATGSVKQQLKNRIAAVKDAIKAEQEERKKAQLQDFYIQKAIKLATAIINSALAITNFLTATPPNIPGAIAAGILGGINVAVIAAEQPGVAEQGAAINDIMVHEGGHIPAEGGEIKGRRHSDGGVKFTDKVTGRKWEAEAGELFVRNGSDRYILNRRSSANPTLRALASAINVAGGGRSFVGGKASSGAILAGGGILGGTLRAPNVEFDALRKPRVQSNLTGGDEDVLSLISKVGEFTAAVNGRFDRLAVLFDTDKHAQVLKQKAEIKAITTL